MEKDRRLRYSYQISQILHNSFETRSQSTVIILLMQRGGKIKERGTVVREHIAAPGKELLISE